VKRCVVLALALCPVLSGQSSGSSDIILKAMRDELDHSRGLADVGLEKPYFISYQIEDVEGYLVTASLGGVVGSSDSHFRAPHIEVRVGGYQFDNTNYVGSGLNFGSHYDLGAYPFEDRYNVLRRYLWLATDQTYKAAVEAIARKRAALKNISAGDAIPDFCRAEPVKRIEEIPDEKIESAAWLAKVRALSAIFAGFSQVLGSDVELQTVKNVRRLVTSEGTEVRTANDVIFMRVRAMGQAPDGMRLRDAVVIHSLGFDRFPGPADLEEQVRGVAENITELSRAPVGETYNGPVLFEGVAAAQLFAELLAKNLVLTRRPVNEPGRPDATPASELEGRQGARVLPEWMDVVDDPTQKEWRGRRLFGSYAVDDEGVQPKPMTMVEKGDLKNFLLTRQPVASYTASNGHARLLGSFGAATAGISNLFVRASQVSPVADLKKKLIEICQVRNQKYGIIVRKLDFPSSASIEELRRLAAGSARAGNGSHLVSLPILIYKVYGDGKEELIRGVQFRDLNVRSLRDIRAAGSDSNVFDYLENGAPLAVMGAGNYAAESSVIAPSVLVDDMEVRKLDEEQPKLPVVPPPALAGR